jgi:hypothetical protein
MPPVISIKADITFCMDNETGMKSIKILKAFINVIYPPKIIIDWVLSIHDFLIIAASEIEILSFLISGLDDVVL